MKARVIKRESTCRHNLISLHTASSNASVFHFFVLQCSMNMQLQLCWRNIYIKTLHSSPDFLMCPCFPRSRDSREPNIALLYINIPNGSQLAGCTLHWPACLPSCPTRQAQFGIYSSSVWTYLPHRNYKARNRQKCNGQVFCKTTYNNYW